MKYQINGLDPEVWAQFRMRAGSEGRSAAWVLRALVAYYAEYGLPEEDGR